MASSVKSVKNVGNQLIAIVVENGAISADEVQNIVSGLSDAQARLLAESLSDDGAIDHEELKAMKKSGKSGCLEDLAVYIGDAPKEMNRIRYIIEDVRAFNRCPGFFRPIGEARTSEGADCQYTLEGWTPDETWDIKDALREIETLQKEGKDIYPIVKLIIESTPSSTALNILATKVDLSGLTIQQAAEMAALMVGTLGSIETSNLVFYLVPLMEILQKIRCNTMDDFQAGGHACFGIDQALASLEGRIVESVRKNLQYEDTYNESLAQKTIALYRTLTGRDISDDVK